MAMKQILIINGHPDDRSLCRALAESYAVGACEGAKCTMVNLGDLQFDANLRFGYREKMPLEPDLIRVQELVKSADFIVFVFPTWWGTYPALLKGFLDRAWLPGFAFKYEKGKLLPIGLLRGRAGRVITTMGAPGWVYRLVYGRPGIRIIRDGVMRYSGIRHIKTTILPSIEDRSPAFYENLIRKMEALGRYDAGRLGQAV